MKSSLSVVSQLKKFIKRQLSTRADRTAHGLQLLEKQIGIQVESLTVEGLSLPSDHGNFCPRLDEMHHIFLSRAEKHCSTVVCIAPPILFISSSIISGILLNLLGGKQSVQDLPLWACNADLAMTSVVRLVLNESPRYWVFPSVLGTCLIKGHTSPEIGKSCWAESAASWLP